MKNRGVQVVGIISVLCCLLWTFSLGWAFYHHWEVRTNPVSQAPIAKKLPDRQQQQGEQPDQAFTIVALGDSLTRGTG